MRTLLAIAIVGFGCGDDGMNATIDARASDGTIGGDASDDGSTAAPWYVGVNLSVAEWGETNLPGIYGTHYTYPTNAEVDYFKSKGMNTLRVSFRWERLQQTLSGALDATEKGRLDAIVNYATAAQMTVILDPHNYARYRDDLVGSTAVPNAAFADFWSRLATAYASNPLVVFGLVNEPHDMVTENWLAAANAAIAAIRSAGATNLVLVPGNAWTGAHAWLQSYYGTPNGTVMLGVVDPMNHFAFEVHQYLDSNFSGTSATCVSTTIGAEKLADFTSWLRTNGYRGFLGELGAADNATCEAAIDNMLDTLEANRDVWIGWAWWAAGPWWGNYMFSIEPDPSNMSDKPQMTWLAPHL